MKLGLIKLGGTPHYPELKNWLVFLTHTHTHTHTYIYMSMCACLCVCVYVCVNESCSENKDLYSSSKKLHQILREQ